MDRNQRTGMLYAFAAVVGYSCLPVFTRNLLDAEIDPISIAFWRFTFAAPLFWVFVWLQNRTALTPRPSPSGRGESKGATSSPSPRIRGSGGLGGGVNLRLLLLGTLLAAAALCAFFGLQWLPAGMFVVIFYTYPAMIAIFSLLMGDRLPIQGWIALGLTLVGVVLTTPDFIALVAPGLGVTPTSTEGLGGDTGRGVLLALLNALVVAVYFLLNSRTLKHYPDKGRASAIIITGTMLTMWLIVLFRGSVTIPQGTSWLYMIGLATISTVFPVFSLTNGIARLGPAKTSIVSTFEPLLTSVLAMLFIGERMQPIQWLGGLVIMLSIILLQVRRPERQAQPLKPVPSPGE
jgi:drug/metabolite transporter (DMT)-like permease